MTDLTLDQLREALERNVATHPHLGPLVSELEDAVRAFWDADGQVDVEPLGAEHFMFNTLVDIRAMLDAVARLPTPAPALAVAGERIIAAWLPAERAVRALGLIK